MRVKLSDVTKYLKGTQINGEDLIENGKYIYLNGGINPSGRWNDANVKGNTVTISEGGNSSGYVNYVTETFWCGAHCYYLFDGPKNTRYLYYALKSQQERLFGIRSGACMPNIKKADLGRFEFEFDTDEQKQSKVVSLLSKVEVVIGERKRELELLEQLIKSRFVELFGDPVSATKEEKVELLELCEKITDGEHGSVARISEGHPFLNAKHILKNGNIDWDTITFIGELEHQRIYKRCNPEPGDILLTTTGTIGNVAIMPECEEVSMDRGITLLKINHEKVTSEFVAELLRQDSVQIEMRANVHASAIGHLFMNKVKKLPAILPAMDRQMEFTKFVKQTDKSKLLVQKSLEETQQLFDALMQKYFS